MKRFQRRIHSADSASGTPPTTPSRGITFDRGTFVECSRRMKRFIPTLSRRSQLGQCDNCETDSKTKVDQAVADKFEPEEVFYSISLDSDEDETDLEEKDLKKRISEPNYNGMSADDTKNSHQPQLSGAGALNNKTFFTGTGARMDIKEKVGTIGRSLFLKPLNQFVSLMGSIGGNLDITSYHTS